jgi:hypothetical protein
VGYAVGLCFGTMAWQRTCIKLAAGCVTLQITSQCLLQPVLGMLRDILRLTQHIRRLSGSKCNPDTSLLAPHTV